jgi:predicted Zn-dependent peptidase
MEKNILKYLSDIDEHKPQIFILSNGIRIVFEEDGKYPTASIGVLVPSGSRFEDKSTAGLSHFMEHILFQGTKNRTTFQISSSIENVGGEINAYTDTQDTLFYVHVPSMHVPLALDVLSDMIMNPLFSDKAIESESKVIEQEIYRSLDEPRDVVSDNLLKAVYGEDPIANKILGTIESVSSFRHQDFVDYHQKHYLAPGLIISIAGTVDIDESLAIMENSFGKIPKGPSIPKWNVPITYAKRIVAEKPTEQTYIEMALPGYPIYSKENFASVMLSVIFGGNMSSRLFQRLRIVEPLVYATGSEVVDFDNSGFLEIMAECSPDNSERVQEVLIEQIELMRKNKITKEELKNAREAVLGNLLMGLESYSNRMVRNATAVYLRGSIRTIDEVVKQVSDISMEMINSIIDNTFDLSKLAVSIVHGPEK